MSPFSPGAPGFLGAHGNLSPTKSQKGPQEPSVHQQGNGKLQKVLVWQIYHELLSIQVDQWLLEVLDPQQPHVGQLHQLDLVLLDLEVLKIPFALEVLEGLCLQEDRGNCHPVTESSFLSTSSEFCNTTYLGLTKGPGSPRTPGSPSSPLLPVNPGLPGGPCTPRFPLGPANKVRVIYSSNHLL